MLTSADKSMEKKPLSALDGRESFTPDPGFWFKYLYNVFVFHIQIFVQIKDGPEKVSGNVFAWANKSLQESERLAT